MYEFLTYVGQPSEINKGALHREIVEGNLTGFLREGNTFTIEDILGTKFFECAENYGPGYFAANHIMNIATMLLSESPCFPYFRMHLNDLREKFPRSSFIRSLIQRADGYTDDYSNPNWVSSRDLPKGLFGIAFRNWLFRAVNDDRGVIISFFPLGEESPNENWRQAYPLEIHLIRNCVVTFSEEKMLGANTICSFNKKLSSPLHFNLY
jgi:hypothetical protein